MTAATELLRTASKALPRAFEARWVDAKGSRIKPARAGRYDFLDANVDGARLRIGDGAAFGSTAKIALEAELDPPLLLGAHVQFASEHVDHLLVVQEHRRPTVFAGIEAHRVQALIQDAPSGRSLATIVAQLDARVTLNDARVRAECIEPPLDAHSLEALMRSVARIARLSSAARAELPEPAWEQRLRSALDHMAVELGLGPPRHFTLGGLAAGVAFTVRLQASSNYVVLGRAHFSRPIGAPIEIARSAGVGGALKKLAGLSSALGQDDRGREYVFSPRNAATTAMLTDGARAAVLGLASLGEVRVANDHVEVCADATTTDAIALTRRLLAVEAALRAPIASSPYR
jgi:hypothetical protein